jgi:multidrug resistance efflux pump
LCVLLAACATDLVEPRRADLVISVEVTGELASTDSVDIKTPVFREAGSFNIAWLATDGADVKAGDAIARFDATDLDRNIESYTADVADAKHRLERRQAEVVLAKRSQDLSVLEAEADAKRAKLKIDVPRELVAALDLRALVFDHELADIALDQVKQATTYARSSDAADLQDLAAAVETATRRLAELQQNRDHLTVVSPRSGTLVVMTAGWPAEKRKVGDSVYSGDTVAQVVGLDTLEGVGVVDEVDLGKLRVDAPVTVRLDAMPDVELRGTLSKITSDVQTRPSDPSKVVRVKLALAAQGSWLRPGMRFHGAIELGRLHGVIQAERQP